MASLIKLARLAGVTVKLAQPSAYPCLVGLLAWLATEAVVFAVAFSGPRASLAR